MLLVSFLTVFGWLLQDHVRLMGEHRVLLSEVTLLKDRITKAEEFQRTRGRYYGLPEW